MDEEALAKRREQTSRACKVYREKFPDRIKEATRVWHKANREALRKIEKAYKARHPERVALQGRTAAAKRRGMTPPWADLDAIRAFYTEAARLTAETGVPHEVDHIWPLNGKSWCGLHVPWNLRVVTKEVNRAKSNRMPTPEELSAC